MEKLMHKPVKKRRSATPAFPWQGLASTPSNAFEHYGYFINTETINPPQTEYLDVALYADSKFENHYVFFIGNISKSILSHQKNPFEKSDSRFFNLSQKFAENQVDLDNDFMEVLNNVTKQTLKTTPSKKRF